MLPWMAQIVASCVKHKQQHLINDIDSLSEEKLLSYMEQLAHIDFKFMEQEIDQLVVSSMQMSIKNAHLHPSSIERVQSSNVITLKDQLSDGFNSQQIQQIGLEAIAKGKVAVVLLAGGQGTRLGLTKPKGMLELHLPSKRTIFSYFVEKLKTLSRLAQKAFPDAQFQRNVTNQASNKNNNADSILIPIRIVIMTSLLTDSETKNYFAENNYFGVCADCFTFIQQASLPSIDVNGKIILSGKNELYLSPDGNGGVYGAMAKANLIETFSEIGIIGVDNILGRQSDPLCVGLMTQNSLHLLSTYVEKRDGAECTGVHTNDSEGLLRMIEYIDMPSELAFATVDDSPSDVNERKQLKFNQSFMCNCYFSLDFLSKAVRIQIPYHVAKKRVKYFDVEQNQLITPDAKVNNACKFELLGFDVFPSAGKQYAVLETRREEQFAPIKNCAENSLVDNPETAAQLLINLHAKWLRNAGYDVPVQGNTPFVIEVDPSISYAGENIPSPNKNLNQAQQITDAITHGTPYLFHGIV